MPDALHRIAYEATVDEAVDVSIRLASKTAAFRRQLRTTVIVVGIIGALVVFAAWMYRRTPPTWIDVAIAAVVAALAGVAVAALFRPLFLKEVRKQQRKVVAELFRGKPAVASEVELRPDVLWVRQTGMEMSFPWTQCERVIDNADDIEMHFIAGLSVVRNRYFSSVTARDSFLETARRLADARGVTSG